ncbi:MAG: hypothetical protein PHG63_00880 [Candidatus Dojkabacteria bacterium]|nr:hypothetical protein [Candidatus Dojkabacteria bacterium]
MIGITEAAGQAETVDPRSPMDILREAANRSLTQEEALQVMEMVSGQVRDLVAQGDELKGILGIALCRTLAKEEVEKGVSFCENLFHEK